METIERALDTINVSKYNPRLMKAQQYGGLLEALRQYGQTESLIVNKDGTLVSGHMRMRAMKELGYETATVIMVDLNETDEKLLNLTMNNTAIAGQYDETKLAELLDEMKLYDTDGYDKFRLSELEPLSNSAKKTDTSTMSSAEDYENKNERQLTLIYTLGEYEEVCHKAESLAKYDMDEYPKDHKSLFIKLVEEEYDKRRTATH